MYVGCCSVAQSCPTLCDPVDCSAPGLPVPHHLLEFAQSSCSLHRWYCLAISSSWCLLLLHSVFPSIRDFSSESSVCFRWPKYWNFSFSISPSSEYSWLISLKIDWFNLLLSKGLSEVFSSTTLWQHQFFGILPSFWSSFHNRGLPWWLRWWGIHLQCGKPGFYPWVRKIPWRREQLRTPVFFLENSMDRGAWQSAVHGVAKSCTQLSDFHFSLSQPYGTTGKIIVLSI